MKATYGILSEGSGTEAVPFAVEVWGAPSDKLPEFCKSDFKLQQKEERRVIRSSFKLQTV